MNYAVKTIAHEIKIRRVAYFYSAAERRSRGVLWPSFAPALIPVDAGNNQAPDPALDILGQPRIQNAKSLSTAIVDMGVYEYPGVPGAPPPPANFTVTVSPSSAVVQQGQSASFSVAITPSAANLGAVTLTCAGLPANASCTFTSSLIAFTSTAQQSSVLTVTTGTAVATASRAHRIDGDGSITLAGLTLVPFLFGLMRRSRKGNLFAGPHLLASICILYFALGLSGCGKNTYVVYTPPQTYSFAVQATAVNSGLSKQAAVTLTVDQ